MDTILGIVLIVLLVSGAIASGLAESKHRNALAWLALGLLGGPFWVVVLLFLGPARVACSACRKKVDAGASICPYCRTERAGG